jgi:C4-dicarboxylate-specific signal transduction histidine kinase
MGSICKKTFENADADDKKIRQHRTELAYVARLNSMGEMATGIAHEISQQLTAILSYSQACIQLLQDEESDTDEIVEILRSTVLQAKHAGEIIKRLRAFVTKQTRQTESVDLNQVVRNILTLSEHALHNRKVNVKTNLAHALPLVDADGIQLEQVVLNLLRNSVDAMDASAISEKIIFISTWVEQDRVAISVRDVGHGIPPSVQDQLFHSFFTTKTDGMGIGLKISYSIIETYGGTLTSRNLPEGGAEFRFSLPLSKTCDLGLARLKVDNV